MKVKDRSIDPLFKPSGFAVIGASDNPSKIGNIIISNLISGGYSGKIFPVNPKHSSIHGIKSYSSVEYIDDEIDSATISIPAHSVVEAVKSCAKKKIKTVQIVTSGFSETGNLEGEAALRSISEETGIRILGPNIFGLYCASSSFNSTFSSVKVKSGNIAIVTQSGALGIAMIGKTAHENIGLSAVVPTGNKCDIDEADILEYLWADESTKVILLYIEGAKNGERLFNSVKKTVSAKPLVFIKSGRSARGAAAAASHTGALSGSDKVFDDLMKQAGAFRASGIDEAFAWCKFFSKNPGYKKGKGVIVTNGGGIGVLATDACEKYGLDLISDEPLMKKIFGPFTPSFGSTKNPVDITSAAKPSDYEAVLSAPVMREEISSTIALFCETSIFDTPSIVALIRKIYNTHKAAGMPVVFAMVGGETVFSAMEILNRENVPVYSDIDTAVSCIALHEKYHTFENHDEFTIPEFDSSAISKITSAALLQGRKFLFSHESFEVIKIAEISSPVTVFAKSFSDIQNAASSIGYPVVMKIVSSDILHKTDAGAVIVDIKDDLSLKAAYESILSNIKKFRPDAVISGFEISEMAKPGFEIIIGARIDHQFGPVVMCGLGGIYAEVFRDVSFRSFPLSNKDAVDMITGLKSYEILMGVRGGSKKDIEIISDTILKTGYILLNCKGISDIEINPFSVYESGSGGKALDVRIILTVS